MRLAPLVIATLLASCDDARSETSTETSPDTGTPPDRDAAPCDVWREGPRLLDQREGSPAFLVEGDRVLLVAGHFDNRTGEPINSSELIDLVAGLSRITGTFNVPRSTTGVGPTVQLEDGRVLSGSAWNWPDQPLLPTEVWDAASGAWTVFGVQNVPASGSGLPLPDGRVLVSGGIVWDSFNGGEDHPIARTELWDRETGEWTLVGDMATPRTGHALVLVDGKAMAIGGFAVYPGGTAISMCEVFDPETASWSDGAVLADPRAAPVLRLDDGRLLSAGGTSESGGNQLESASAEIYDPVAQEWEAVAPMLEARAQHQLTLLQDGRVLVTGGAHAYFSYSTDSAEIFDPVMGNWSRAAPMGSDRRGHGAVLLPNGEVIVTGGYPGGVRTTEIYTPCY